MEEGLPERCGHQSGMKRHRGDDSWQGTSVRGSKQPRLEKGQGTVEREGEELGEQRESAAWEAGATAGVRGLEQVPRFLGCWGGVPA